MFWSSISRVISRGIPSPLPLPLPLLPLPYESLVSCSFVLSMTNWADGNPLTTVWRRAREVFIPIRPRNLFRIPSITQFCTATEIKEYGRILKERRSDCREKWHSQSWDQLMHSLLHTPLGSSPQMDMVEKEMKKRIRYLHLESIDQFGLSDLWSGRSCLFYISNTSMASLTRKWRGSTPIGCWMRTLMKREEMKEWKERERQVEWNMNALFATLSNLNYTYNMFFMSCLMEWHWFFRVVYDGEGKRREREGDGMGVFIHLPYRSRWDSRVVSLFSLVISFDLTRIPFFSQLRTTE